MNGNDPVDGGGSNVGAGISPEAPHFDFRGVAIPSLLESLRAASGASEVVWLGGERAMITRRSRGPSSTARLCREFAWLLHARGSRLDSSALDRIPTMRGNEFRGALLCRGGEEDKPANALVFFFAEPTSAGPERDEPESHPGSRSPNAIGDIEVLAEIGRSAATLAHDLRHLLTLAGMQLERVRASRSEGVSDLELDDLGATLEEARAYCDAGLPGRPREARRGTSSLRDLLEATAQEAGRIAGPNRSVGVNVRCPVALSVERLADPLARLVRNLVLNAIEASKDGAQVRVEASQPDASHTELCIGDCGRGMGPEELEQFYSRVCSGGSGTGIGTLSILDAARDIGATIRIESQPSRGTRVHVVLPNESCVGKATLVVDGHGGRRRRTVALCAARGRSTKQAASASAALEVLERDPIERVIAARATVGPGWETLRDRVRELGVHLSVQSVLDA